MQAYVGCDRHIFEANSCLSFSLTASVHHAPSLFLANHSHKIKQAITLWVLFIFRSKQYLSLPRSATGGLSWPTSSSSPRGALYIRVASSCNPGRSLDSGPSWHGPGSPCPKAGGTENWYLGILSCTLAHSVALRHTSSAAGWYHPKRSWHLCASLSP